LTFSGVTHTICRFLKNYELKVSEPIGYIVGGTPVFNRGVSKDQIITALEQLPNLQTDGPIYIEDETSCTETGNLINWLDANVGSNTLLAIAVQTGSKKELLWDPRIVPWVQVKLGFIVKPLINWNFTTWIRYQKALKQLRLVRLRSRKVAGPFYHDLI